MIRRRSSSCYALAFTLAAASCGPHTDAVDADAAPDVPADATIDSSADSSIDAPGDNRSSPDATPTPDAVDARMDVAADSGAEAAADASGAIDADAATIAMDAIDSTPLPDAAPIVDISPAPDVVVSTDTRSLTDAAVDAPDAGDGATPPVTGAPIISGACRYWPQMPPAVAYVAPVPTDDGVFVGGSDGLAMRYAGGGWSVANEPDRGFSGIFAGGPTFAAAVRPSLASSSIVLLAGGTSRTIALSARANQAWVLGTDLYVSTYPANDLLRYDGATWTTIRTSISGTLLDLAGTATDLYAIVDGALQHYDGASWSLVGSGGYLDVASPGPGEVYVLNASSIQQVSGSTFTAVAGPPSPCGSATPRDVYLRSAPGYLLLAVDCNMGSTGPTYLYRRASPAGAWDALPAFSSELLASIDSHGAVYGVSTANNQQRVYRADASTWADLTQSEAPPSGQTTGDATHGWYAGGANGVARLVGNAWSAIPGAPALPAARLWASRDGTLFVLYGSGAGSATALWRYASGAWTMLATGTLAERNPELIGRSATDLYFASGDTVVHWDGTSATSLGTPCASHRTTLTQLSRIYTAGDTQVVAVCYYEARGGRFTSVNLHSGGAWSEYQYVTWTGAITNPSSVGVATDRPSVFVPNIVPPLNQGTIRTETAWVPATYPTGYTNNVLGATTARFFGSDPGTLNVVQSVARTDGVDWTRISNWTTPAVASMDLTQVNFSGWTDGRYVIGPSNGHGPGVAICDFGP